MTQTQITHYFLVENDGTILLMLLLVEFPAVATEPKKKHTDHNTHISQEINIILLGSLKVAGGGKSAPGTHNVSLLSNLGEARKK